MKTSKITKLLKTMNQLNDTVQTMNSNALAIRNVFHWTNTVTTEKIVMMAPMKAPVQPLSVQWMIQTFHRKQIMWMVQVLWLKVMTDLGVSKFEYGHGCSFNFFVRGDTCVLDVTVFGSFLVLHKLFLLKLCNAFFPITISAWAFQSVCANMFLWKISCDQENI